MTLKEQINADFVTAFKNKETAKKDTLGMLKSKITEAEKKAGTVATDADVIAAVQALVKQRQQTIQIYQGHLDGGNQHLMEAINKEQAELDILQAYLPKQLTEEEIREIVKNHTQPLQVYNGSNMGQCVGAMMRIFKEDYNGQYEPRLVKEITESILKEQL